MNGCAVLRSWSAGHRAVFYSFGVKRFGVHIVVLHGESRIVALFFVHLVSQQHEGPEIDLVRFVCMLRRLFSGAGDGPLFLDVYVLSPSMRVRYVVGF